MEPTNEPGPADGQAKMEAQVKNDVDAQYQELLKREQEALEEKFKGDATAKYEEVRKLGFATKKDIDQYVQGMFGKFFEEIKTMREENTKLREWVMRAKAHGLNSGAMEDTQPSDNPMKKWKPSW